MAAYVALGEGQISLDTDGIHGYMSVIADVH